MRFDFNDYSNRGRNIDKTSVYRTTFFLLQIVGGITSGLCELAALVFLFLDKNKFPLKFVYFGYFLFAGLIFMVVNSIVTSIMLRFVFREDINYPQKKICKNNNENNEEIINNNDNKEEINQKNVEVSDVHNLRHATNSNNASNSPTFSILCLLFGVLATGAIIALVFMIAKGQ